MSRHIGVVRAIRRPGFDGCDAAAGGVAGIDLRHQRDDSPAPVAPANAACNAAMSILTIFIIASDARLALARSGSAIISPRMVGTICHETPNRSFSQPHCSAEPPWRSAFQ